MTKPRRVVTFDSPIVTRGNGNSRPQKKQKKKTSPEPEPVVAADADAAGTADAVPPAIPDVPPTPKGTFDATRPATLKPTSNRKTTGAKNPHPYTRAYLLKNLGLSGPDWDTVLAAIVEVFEVHMDLMAVLRQPEVLCARLNEIGLPDEVLQLLPAGSGECGFYMYHVALLARRKVTAQSALKQIAGLRKTIVMIENNAKGLEATVTDLKTQTAANTADIAELKTDVKEAVKENNQDMLVQFRMIMKEEVKAGRDGAALG